MHTKINETEMEPGYGLVDRLLILITGGLGVVIAAALLLFALWGMGAVLVVADTLKSMDAVVALSGGSMDRVDEAAKMYKEGYARRVVFTETTSQVASLGASYTKLYKTEAISLGVPDRDILVTSKPASSTYDEAKAVLSLMNDQGFNSMIVVTDPYHSFRTRLIFREVFRGSGKSIRVRPSSGHWYRSTTWWLSAQGWEATLTEYIKLAGFLVGFRGD